MSQCKLVISCRSKEKDVPQKKKKRNKRAKREREEKCWEILIIIPLCVIEQ
jgi:hypothetical protein